MSQARTMWVASDEQHYGPHAVRSRQRRGVLLAAALLCVMTVAEVLFLNYVAGPDGVAMMMRAEGVAVPD
jgi:hypothetical protein